MPYKISGTKNETARIIVLKESDWSIESNTVVSGSGEYEITGMTIGKKSVMSMNDSGQFFGYGYVDSYSYGDTGLFMGGKTNTDDNTAVNVIDSITISTTGNATDFGDLLVAKFYGASTSNGGEDRGIFAGGRNSSGTALDVIGYVSISSSGNTSDFGDMTTTKEFISATSNNSNDRGIIGGGQSGDGGTAYNVIEYFTISTTGNTSDFGDLLGNTISPSVD